MSVNAGRQLRWTGRVVSLLALLLAACPAPPVPPRVRAVSVMPLFKPSCDSICGSTCMACVDTLQVFATDPDGQPLSEPRCFDISGRWETLCDVARKTPLQILQGLPVDRPLVIELRAYRHRQHVEDAGLACLPPERDGPWSCEVYSGDLMLWGRSRTTDLSADAGAARITVELECRSGCDCIDIAAGRRGCPEAMPESVCRSGTRCDKPCHSDEDCFEGALRCDVDAGACDPGAEGVADRPFCAVCQQGSDCAGGVCVGQVGQDGGYCARSCPDRSCPRAAKCTPLLDGGVLRRLF